MIAIPADAASPADGAADGRAFDLNALRQWRTVAFVLRKDHKTKSGGDVDLTWQLARAAQALGVNVVTGTVDELPALGSGDALFLFNIDHPYDAWRAAAKFPDTTAYLYALHHPRAGESLYLRDGAVGLQNRLARLTGHDPARNRAMVDLIKGGLHRDFARMKFAAGHMAHSRALLARCRVLVAAPAEAHELEHAYGVSLADWWVLPHPVAKPVGAAAGQWPRYLLIAGRVEPRKNQLAALHFLARHDIKARFGVEVVVVGGSGSNTGYFQQVVAACLDHRFLYCSQLPKELFFPTVSNAALVVNPSYFEVTSLIDLYAIEQGLPVITTRHGYYAPAPNVHAIDPSGWRTGGGDILTAIETILARQDA